MKNYLFLGLMGAAVFFNSCSSNDDNDETTGNRLLLSKVTTTYADPLLSFLNGSQIMEYNSKGQLIKMQSSEGISTFEYNNGKPVKANNYNVKQQLESYFEFNYSGDQLTSNKLIHTNSQNNRTHQYTYNAAGQLTTYTICKSANCSDPSIETYTYNGGNVSLRTLKDDELVSEYSYDNKVNPYTNTNKYLKVLWANNEILSKNNCTISRNNSKHTGQDITVYTFEYNSSGFPIKTIGKSNNGELFVQYDYEYITL